MSQFQHIPVMMAEVLEALQPVPSGRYADGTLGGGGHALAVLRKSAPTGWLYGCDRDGEAIQAASATLAEFAGRFEIRRENFCDLDRWIEPGTLDGVLLDLGCSSHQFDSPGRGFGIKNSGPLDMRQDDRQMLTAFDVLATYDEASLAKIFWEYGDEKFARRYARLVAERKGSIKSTGELAQLIERNAPGGYRGGIHPATKIFQALRIVVNDELGSLSRGLESVWRCLRKHGRLVVISFHSGEDRLVKRFGRVKEKDYRLPDGCKIDVPELRIQTEPQLRWVSRKAVEPTAREIETNPRSRSAKLRVMEKLGH